MHDFFDYFEIAYSEELNVHFEHAKEALQKNGNDILDFEKHNIYTYTKEHLCEIRDIIKKDKRNVLFCYFLNSVLKTNNTELINSVCAPKCSQKSEIFDCLPLFSLLYEIPGMCERLQTKGISRDIIDATCNMFENQLQDYIDLYGHYGISAYVTWLLLFINNKIIRIGRFNFEIAELGNYYVYRDGKSLLIDTEQHDKVLIAKPRDTIVSVHIPSGGRLDYDENTSDLIRAEEIFSRLFGDFKLFYCESWLLDPKIAELLGKETNMTRFAKRFTRIPVKNSCTSVFTYLYHTTDAEDIDALSENTSMQRAIKKHLKSGGKISNHHGVFEKGDLLK